VVQEVPPERGAARRLQLSSNLKRSKVGLRLWLCRSKAGSKAGLPCHAALHVPFAVRQLCGRAALGKDLREHRCETRTSGPGVLGSKTAAVPAMTTMTVTAMTTMTVAETTTKKTTKKTTPYVHFTGFYMKNQTTRKSSTSVFDSLHDNSAISAIV